jgi:hypothetical protein
MNADGGDAEGRHAMMWSTVVPNKQSGNFEEMRQLGERQTTDQRHHMIASLDRFKDAVRHATVVIGCR